MMLLTAFCGVVVIAYLVWFFCRVWSLWQQMLRANGAQEILTNVLNRGRNYVLHFIISFVGLAILMGVKAILTLSGHFGKDTVTLFVFGSLADQSLVDKLGLAGLCLAAISLFSVYQYLKSNHHFQVLHTLRKELGLDETIPKKKPS